MNNVQPHAQLQRTRVNKSMNEKPLCADACADACTAALARMQPLASFTPLARSARHSFLCLSGRSFLPAVASCVRISVGKHADTLSHRVNVCQLSTRSLAQPQWKVKMSGLRNPQHQHHHHHSTNRTPNILKKEGNQRRKGTHPKSPSAGVPLFLSLHSSVVFLQLLLF